MFENAKWITFVPPVQSVEKPYVPSPYIAKTFTVKSAVEKAVLNICGYGEAAYFLNGQEIPDGIRPTVPSTTPIAVVYNVYDLTDLLQVGKNRLGILVSYHRCWGKNAHPLMTAAKTPEVILQLEIAYKDGTKETVVSDTAFRSHGSHIVFTNNVCGEIHDARYFLKDWCSPDCDDSDWVNVIEAHNPGGEYRPAVCPPIRRLALTSPTEIAPNLYDFGITTSGQVRAVISGKAGAKVRVQYAERLTADGKHVDMSAYLKNNRPYPDMYNTAEFVLDGTENEVFEELFSIHGFRYVEVTGDCDAISLQAVTVHTDMAVTSSFSCSDAILNRLHNACINSILTCCQGYFVDNPKRDAAWVGDQMLSAEAIAMNFDAFTTSYENMLMCRDAVTEDGIIPNVLPAIGPWNYSGFLGPEWSAGVVFHVPYFTYRYTGNRKIVDSMWDTMDKVLASFTMFSSPASPYLLDHGGTGDWSAVREGCSLEVAMTSYYYISAMMMAELAEATDRESRSYRQLAEHIRTAYREKYIADGKIKGNHISEYILPTALGFLQEDEVPAAVDTVIAMIEQDKMAFTFGTHGMRMIYDLLSATGHADFMESPA